MFQRIIINWVNNVCLVYPEPFIRLDRNSCLVVVSPCELAFGVHVFVLFCLGVILFYFLGLFFILRFPI